MRQNEQMHGIIMSLLLRPKAIYVFQLQNLEALTQVLAASRGDQGACKSLLRMVRFHIYSSPHSAPPLSSHLSCQGNQPQISQLDYCSLYDYASLWESTGLLFYHSASFLKLQKENLQTLTIIGTFKIHWVPANVNENEVKIPISTRFLQPRWLRSPELSSRHTLDTEPLQKK